MSVLIRFQRMLTLIALSTIWLSSAEANEHQMEVVYAISGGPLSGQEHLNHVLNLYYRHSLGPIHLGAGISYGYSPYRYEDADGDYHGVNLLGTALWRYDGWTYVRPYVGIDVGGGVLVESSSGWNGWGNGTFDSTRISPIFIGRARGGLAFALIPNTFFLNIEGQLGFELSQRETDPETLIASAAMGLVWEF
jgi:hypothetical protein